MTKSKAYQSSGEMKQLEMSMELSLTAAEEIPAA